MNTDVTAGESALEKGVIDALYTQSGPLQQLSEARGKFTAIEDLSRHPSGHNWGTPLISVLILLGITRA